MTPPYETDRSRPGSPDSPDAVDSPVVVRTPEQEEAERYSQIVGKHCAHLAAVRNAERAAELEVWERRRQADAAAAAAAAESAAGSTAESGGVS